MRGRCRVRADGDAALRWAVVSPGTGVVEGLTALGTEGLSDAAPSPATAGRAQHVAFKVGDDDQVGRGNRGPDNGVGALGAPRHWAWS